MSHRRGGQAGKPLSAKGAALLASLQAHGPSGGESRYVGGLVEAAERRKRAGEAALEKKLLAEAQREGASRTFVTRAYEERLEATMGADGAVQALMRNAERVGDSAAAKRTRQGERAAASKGTDAGELERRRQARRTARKAPESRLTPEVIESARNRALIRLALST